MTASHRGASGCNIQTASGILFPFDNPTPDDVDIGDIAQSLSRMPRFLGHSNSIVTVAQHSVAVMHRVAETHPQAALAALLHDSHEAYIGDMPGPLKRRPEIKAVLQPIEDGIQKAIHEKFGVPFPLPPEWAAVIKAADVWALTVEAMHGHRIEPEDWNLMSVDQPENYSFMDEDESWWAFIDAFQSLTGITPGKKETTE